jgi:pSer/pThr/pTyr-binding forkhead associated (FHA) protein
MYGDDDASPFALRVTDSTSSRLHRLSTGRTIVGRADTADVKIDEIFAARRHCALDWSDRQACHLLSVWGPNGVGVNGASLPSGTEPRPMSAGDEICVGGVSLRYERVAETTGIASYPATPQDPPATNTNNLNRIRKEVNRWDYPEEIL